MTLIQKIGKIALLSVIIAAFTSCNDDDPIPFSVIGDVLTSKKEINGEIHYAKVYYAHGTNAMTSAKVKTPDGVTVTLESANTQNVTFAKEPVDADYTTDVPENGTYKFTVMNQSVEYTANDDLAFNDMDIATITEATFDDATQSISLKWEEVNNADSYLVRVKDAQGENIFLEPLLNADAVAYKISDSTGKWSKTPSSGDELTVELSAFNYEANATNANYIRHIEEMTIAAQTVTWE